MNKLNTRKIILVTGASRSGKSEYAESLAMKTTKSVIYLATAKTDPEDAQWQARIAQHQQRRPQNWQTETKFDADLSLYVAKASDTECLLIDSIGTWLANFLQLDRSDWSRISHDFLTSIQTSKADIILVGEETGWGVVPAYPSGRLFRDRLGYFSRQIANIADTTYLVAGGHVLNLSLLGEPLSMALGKSEKKPL